MVAASGKACQGQRMKQTEAQPTATTNMIETCDTQRREHKTHGSGKPTTEAAPTATAHDAGSGGADTEAKPTAAQGTKYTRR